MALLTDGLLTNKKISPFEQLYYYYNRGNEYGAKTGGWMPEGYTNSSYTLIPPVKEVDCIILAVPNTSSRSSIIGTYDMIDFTKLSKIHVKIEMVDSVRDFGVVVKASKPNIYSSPLAQTNLQYAAEGFYTVTLNVSHVTQEAYLILLVSTGGSNEGGAVTIYEVWGE